MKKTTSIIFPLSVASIALMAILLVSSFKTIVTTPIGKPQGIVWYSYAEGSALAEKKNKKIFVDVYTDWCGWCKHMDKTTFKDTAVIKYMNENFIAVKLNAESTTATSYQGKVLLERELALNILRVQSFPTVVFLDERQNLIQSVLGYQDAEKMLKQMRFFGDNHYKSKTYTQFEEEEKNK